MSPRVSGAAYREAFQGVAEYAARWVRDHPRASAADLAARLAAQASALAAIRRGHCPRCQAPVRMPLGASNWLHENGRRACPE